MDRKLRDCAEDVFGSPVGSLTVRPFLYLDQSPCFEYLVETDRSG